MARVSLQYINIGDTGEQAKNKSNQNFDAMNAELGSTESKFVQQSNITNMLDASTSKIPTAYAVTNALSNYLPKSEATVGTLLLDDKANYNEIRTLTDSKKGYTHKAIDTGDYWTYKVENNEPYDPNKWVNIGKLLPSDYATSADLLKVRQQLTYQPAFPLKDAYAFTDQFTSYIWCIDYFVEEIIGLRLKVRSLGKLNLYKVDVRTEAYQFIKQIDQPSGEATIQDILFDEPIKLKPYERLGLNGNVYYKANDTDVLRPKMYVIEMATGAKSTQYGTVIAYALITPNDITKMEQISDKVEALEFIADRGDLVAEQLIRQPGRVGYGGADVLTTASLLELKSSGYITSVTINAVKNTDIHIVLFDISAGTAYECDRIVVRTDHEGLNTFETSMFALKGQYLGFYKGTSKFYFDFNLLNPECYFLQFPVPNETNRVFTNGWVGLSYTLKESHNTDIDILANGYANGRFYHGLIAPRSGYKVMSPNKWVTFNSSPISFEGKLRKLWIDVQTAGNITIGVGIVDQRGWAIVDQQYVVNVPNSGLNEISVSNISLNENQRLFIKTGLSIGYNEGGTHYESTEGGIQLSYVQDELIFKYQVEGKRFVESPVASNLELTEVKNEVSSISSKLNTLGLSDLYIQSPDGSFWSQSISNDGVISWNRVVGKKITVFGNSFEIHPVTDLWWGRFGMAASRRENDWVHRLSQKLSAEGIPSTITPYSIAEPINGGPGWEQDAANFDFSRLDPNLPSDTDLVILRIGENNPNTPTLTADTIYLINYIRSKVPNVPIILGGLFWTNQDKQAKLRAAADHFGIPFIDFQDLDQPQYKSTYGAQTLGDDGIWHTITNGSVANHAGDAGMEAMADRILPYVLNIL